VLTKSIGTNNPINQVKATMEGLRGLRKPEDVAELRGLTIKQVLGVPKDAEKSEASGEDAEGAVEPVAVATEEAPAEAEAASAPVEESAPSAEETTS
jgi:small subunit ribosomal protein S5